MRNLLRIKEAKIIPCPTPYYVKDNILVMSFIGKDAIAAPCLKDAIVDEEKLRELYYQCIKLMRNLYRKCHLIHADLSEYNLLLHKGTLYVIDVSQSVEWDHPNALDFLRNDCSAITSFFKKSGIHNCMSTKELFDFITDITIENEDKYLDGLQNDIESRLENPPSVEEQIKESLFQQAHIPRSLNGLKTNEEPLSPGIYGLSPNKYENSKLSNNNNTS